MISNVNHIFIEYTKENWFQSSVPFDISQARGIVPEIWGTLLTKSDWDDIVRYCKQLLADKGWEREHMRRGAFCETLVLTSISIHKQSTNMMQQGFRTSIFDEFEDGLSLGVPHGIPIAAYLDVWCLPLHPITSLLYSLKIIICPFYPIISLLYSLTIIICPSYPYICNISYYFLVSFRTTMDNHTS